MFSCFFLVSFCFLCHFEHLPSSLLNVSIYVIGRWNEWFLCMEAWGGKETRQFFAYFSALCGSSPNFWSCAMRGCLLDSWLPDSWGIRHHPCRSPVDTRWIQRRSRRGHKEDQILRKLYWKDSLYRASGVEEIGIQFNWLCTEIFF